jgi:hypothetical protein
LPITPKNEPTFCRGRDRCAHRRSEREEHGDRATRKRGDVAEGVDDSAVPVFELQRLRARLGKPVQVVGETKCRGVTDLDLVALRLVHLTRSHREI